MNLRNKDSEYLVIVKDILDNYEFRELSSISHHNHNRLDHCLKISYYSYKISKLLKLDYKETARAGLLHDFYLDRTVNHKKIKNKFLLYTTKHPVDAISNSKKHFYLTAKEMDIIKTHMFPFDVRLPKYLESWIVNLVDTSVSTYEFVLKFTYSIFGKLKKQLKKIYN